jgi:release factor glutamine methyltransferase
MQNKEEQWLLQEKHGGIKTPAFFNDLKRLEQGEHSDYVIGFVDFLGCRIDLSEKPLIPRPETEYWVTIAIEDMLKLRARNDRPSTSSQRDVGVCALGDLSSPSSEPRQIASESSFLVPEFSLKALDLFSGSGCIGVAVLHHTQAVVHFGEKEKRFVKQIQKNTKDFKKERYQIVQTDMFLNVSGQYDYILANPPYCIEENIQENVLQQEPKEALLGGKDGLEIIEQFLKEAKNHIKPGGKIYMEFDSFQKEKIEAMLKEFCYSSFEFYKDQYSKWRFLTVSA